MKEAYNASSKLKSHFFEMGIKLILTFSYLKSEKTPCSELQNTQGITLVNPFPRIYQVNVNAVNVNSRRK